MRTARLLLAYVRRSNAIEHLRPAPTHPIFRQHLAAAALVAALPPTTHLTPADLHAIIMPGLLPRYLVGQYRTVHEVTINGKHAPKAAAVSRLMREHARMVAVVLDGFRKNRVSRNDLELLLETIFHLGLIIHPFVDGNGRTFRLYHNYLRQQCGLPWEQYRVRGWEWVDHLIQLRHHEKIFRRKRRRSYPPTPTR